VVEDFERYWKNPSARRARQLLPPAQPEQLQALAAACERLVEEPVGQAYALALRESAFLTALQQGELAIDWAPARLLSDDPAKVLGRARPRTLVQAKLEEAIGRPERSLALVSAYFVPTRGGIAALAMMARRGVKVRVLTNSLEATDVTAVHAGYIGCRRPLLRAGATLYELQRLSAHRRKRKGRGRFGRSATSLHAKTFAVDGVRAFVGSFNFDPRSARLNTEMGLVIDCPELATRIEASFIDEMAEYAYEVRLRSPRRLCWIQQRAAGPVQLDTEPGAALWRRVLVWCISRLPIHWML
jgi:cardiolipin synthase C